MALKTENKILSTILSSTQNKTYTVFVITILTIVLMVAFAITPAYVSITNKMAENEAKQEYIDELDTYLANIALLTSQQNSYTEEIKLLDTYYPNQSNSEFYVNNITSIATQYACHVGSISFTKSQKSLESSQIDNFGSVSRVPMYFSIVGELSNMQLFLAHLESFPALIKVSSISYTMEGAENYIPEYEDSDRKYVMSITAEYFYWNFLEANE